MESDHLLIREGSGVLQAWLDSPHLPVHTDFLAPSLWNHAFSLIPYPWGPFTWITPAASLRWMKSYPPFSFSFHFTAFDDSSPASLPLSPSPPALCLQNSLQICYPSSTPLPSPLLPSLSPTAGPPQCLLISVRPLGTRTVSCAFLYFLHITFLLALSRCSLKSFVQCRNNSCLCYLTPLSFGPIFLI